MQDPPLLFPAFLPVDTNPSEGLKQSYFPNGGGTSSALT